MRDFDLDDGDTTVRVEIRLDTINGATVGATTSVPPGGLVACCHFPFAKSVRVERGRTCVIRVSADENWGVAVSSDAYPLGKR